MNRLFAAALLLFVSTASHAQEAAPSGLPADAAAAPAGPIVVEGPGKAEEKVVCRRESSTGSIRRQRVCRTESQLAQEQSQGERTLDTARTQRHSQNVSQNQSGG